MQVVTQQLGGSAVQFYMDASVKQFSKIADKKNTVLITDDQVYAAWLPFFKGWKTVVIHAGEANKQQSTVDTILKELVLLQADRSTLLVGIGGGVVTDITGYAASVFMRGIRFGFIPTSLLAMVDASIGGKNGVDMGAYKNLVGTIRQPEFVFYDYRLLATLHRTEWQGGFAEIIKHAAIKDRKLFQQLQANTIDGFQKNKKRLAELIQQNVHIKTQVVKKDPFEKGERKLLNFGHTLGHAIENDLGISHGEAVSVGMVYAAHLSATITGFKQTHLLTDTIEQYELPTHAAFDMQMAINRMQADKKRVKNAMHFVLLERIGKAIVEEIQMVQLKKLLLST